jgi:hypothetical protein
MKNKSNLLKRDINDKYIYENCSLIITIIEYKLNL